MLKLIRFLFTGSWHEHRWEIINKSFVTSDLGSTYDEYTLQCIKCGNLKRKAIK